MRSSDPEVESLARLAAAISTYGYAIQTVGNGCSVPGCTCSPSARPWAYTIGLGTLDHPELIVFGLPDSFAGGLLTHVVGQHADGDTLPIGREHDLDVEGWPIRLLPVPARSVAPDRDLLAGWYGYYSALGPCSPPEVVQVVWADDDDRFPWQMNFDSRLRFRQPVLEMQPNAVRPSVSQMWPRPRSKRPRPRRR